MDTNCRNHDNDPVWEHTNKVRCMLLKKSVVVCLLSFALAACDVDVETEVSLSQLLSKENGSVIGHIYAEVSACQDYQDSRKESSSLVKVKEQIPTIFDEAKYVECFRKKMDSFAHFEVPVSIIANPEKAEFPKNRLSIDSTKRLLDIVIPQEIKTSMDAVSDGNPMSGGFDLSVTIKVINDYDKPYPLTLISGYLDGSPIQLAQWSADANSAFTMKLSDVSVDKALEDGRAYVLDNGQ